MRIPIRIAFTTFGAHSKRFDDLLRTKAAATADTEADTESLHKFEDKYFLIGHR